MIRFLNAYFPARTIFLGISEACLVAAAFVGATVVRLGYSGTGLVLGYQNGAAKIVVVLGVFIICMYYFDLYNSSVLSNRREVLIRLIQAVGTLSILLALVYYLDPALELGRGIALIGIAFVALLISAWRKIFAVINGTPRFADRALIFGDGPLAESIIREFESRPELGLRVVSRAGADSTGKCHLSYSSTVALDAEIEPDEHGELSEIVKALRVNRIVVAMSERRGRLPVALLLSLKCEGVRVQDGTEVYEAVTGKVPIDFIRSGWLLFASGFHLSHFLLLYKRLASALVSIVGLLLTIPLLPFVIAAIKLTSPGSILYRQRRVGRAGVVFDCFKFRTMRADAEADTGPTWAADDDPRITRVGRFFRKTRLDEIPQLWNVLKGDMSLVGPRPERPEFVDALVKDIPFYNLRHTVRPGITGWAQISYKYGASIEDAKEKLRYDLFYIKNMSPGLDLLVALKTIKIIVLGRGAK